MAASPWGWEPAPVPWAPTVNAPPWLINTDEPSPDTLKNAPESPELRQELDRLMNRRADECLTDRVELRRRAEVLHRADEELASATALRFKALWAAPLVLSARVYQLVATPVVTGCCRGPARVKADKIGTEPAKAGAEPVLKDREAKTDGAEADAKAGEGAPAPVPAGRVAACWTALKAPVATIIGTKKEDEKQDGFAAIAADTDGAAAGGGPPVIASPSEALAEATAAPADAPAPALAEAVSTSEAAPAAEPESSLTLGPAAPEAETPKPKPKKRNAGDRGSVLNMNMAGASAAGGLLGSYAKAGEKKPPKTEPTASAQETASDAGSVQPQQPSARSGGGEAEPEEARKKPPPKKKGGGTVIAGSTSNSAVAGLLGSVATGGGKKKRGKDDGKSVIA